MFRWLIILISFALSLPVQIKSEIINKPVVNIYIHPEEATEVDSQAIYGSSVLLIKKTADGWTKIQTADGLCGWIKSSELTSNSAFEAKVNLRSVKNLFAHIYRVTDIISFPPLLTIPYGAQVKLIKAVDPQERWVAIELVSKEKAWIQREDLDFAPKLKTLEETLAFSKKFLGLPYTWGGVSTFGFDCSGFIQMLFKEMGFLLPRNAQDQAQSPLFIPVAKKELQPGDLIFFGTAKITHVGLYLGNDQFIHSGVKDLPIIMVSTLQSSKYEFYAARRLKPAVLNKH